MDRPIFEVSSLKHSYFRKTILEIDRLSIQKSSIVGLVGPNGSGKSSFLRLLGLVEKPTEGKILFDGVPVEPFSTNARFLVSLLPQEPFLMKRSVYKNVSYGLKFRVKTKNIPERVEKALSTVGLSYNTFAQRPWYALSGGEMQRVAFAARLALNPSVLLLDEPTANVDAHSAQLIKEASIRVRNQSGTTLIIASHDLHWLYEICDEILHLFKGKIFDSGRESFIYGPWKNIESKKWGKRLSDGQILYVTQPPSPGATAVVNFVPIDKENACRGDGEIALKGIVSRLSLEKKSGRIFATILVGEMPLTVKLPQQNAENTLYPGNHVFLKYYLDQVKWIECNPNS